MAVRKRANSWQYDFKLQGYRRQRKGRLQDPSRGARSRTKGARRPDFRSQAHPVRRCLQPVPIGDDHERSQPRSLSESVALRSNPCSDTSSSKRSTPRRWTRSSAPFRRTSDRNRSTTGLPSCEPYSGSVGNEGRFLRSPTCQRNVRRRRNPTGTPRPSATASSPECSRSSLAGTCSSICRPDSASASRRSMPLHTVASEISLPSSSSTEASSGGPRTGRPHS